LGFDINEVTEMKNEKIKVYIYTRVSTAMQIDILWMLRKPE
jgi:hypothetical protein